MWNDDEEVNEEGQTVKLFLPVNTGGPRKTDTSPRESHIGGRCFFDDVTPRCDHCQAAMYLLVQLRLDSTGLQQQQTSSDKSMVFDRYLCLFVCPPQEECFGRLTYNKGFSSGGQGVVKCVQRYVPADVSPNKQVPPVSAAPNKSSWYADDSKANSTWGNDNDDDNGNNNTDDDDDNDYWGMDGEKTDDTVGGLATLENAVAAMEETLGEDGAFVPSLSSKANLNGREQQKGITTHTTPSDVRDDDNPAFDCYLLKVQNEPPPPRPIMEEDDVGLTESDEKIRNMLARYMAEEEDEDILAALRGSNAIGGGGATEEDERLSDEDRILLGFQDRLRRVPKQVVRYAPGGRPLWSLPDRDRKSKEPLWSVPVCPRSGEDRTFMFQVLPSVLEILDVDKHVTGGSKRSTGTTIGGGDGGNKPVALDYLMSNGMNFGSIAVFCSPNPSDMEEMDTFLVIQESVDGVPAKGRRIGAGVNDEDVDFPVATMAVMEDLDDDGDFEPDA